MELRIMNLNGEKCSEEYIELTKYILKGKTIPEIADKFNYSQSTISNRLNVLFRIYNASNRFEFINNFFYIIIQKYKAKLKTINKQNRFLKSQINNLEKNILNNKKYSAQELINWINSCKEYLK